MYLYIYLSLIQKLSYVCAENSFCFKLYYLITKYIQSSYAFFDVRSKVFVSYSSVIFCWYSLGANSINDLLRLLKFDNLI